jgi:Ion channel
MSALWAVLGVAVLGIGLLDVFLTTLNYDGSGFLAAGLSRLQWCAIRALTRRLPQRWRPVALRQVMGLSLVLNMTVWLGVVIIGFGLIYLSQMHGANFEFDGRGLHNGLFSAMYYSAAQLSTVGTGQISPQTDGLRALSIAETMAGLGLVTLILSFLFGVYQVVRDLRTLSASLATGDEAIADPIASLGPYLARGELDCLDNHLRAIAVSFWSYADGLRQHHIAYYFQSGRDQFALPYVLHMLGHWLAALRWGLPSGHPASGQPQLTQLSAQVERFGEHLHGELGWASAPGPSDVSFQCFLAACCAGEQTTDLWLARFLRMEREMVLMASLDTAVDPRESYERYQQWLPSAYRAELMTAAVSRDLDYRALPRTDCLDHWPSHEGEAGQTTTGTEEQKCRDPG